MVAAGLLTRADDPTHRQKAIYSLTEMAIDLIPIMAQLGAWGRKWRPVSVELEIRARLLEEGGPELWRQFMDELREEHFADRRHESIRSGRGRSAPGCRRPMRTWWRSGGTPDAVHHRARSAGDGGARLVGLAR